MTSDQSLYKTFSGLFSIPCFYIGNKSIKSDWFKYIWDKASVADTNLDNPSNRTVIIILKPLIS